MPFDHIQVTASDLTAASAKFNATVSELDTQLQNVQNQIESLQSTWQGQAASDFVSLMMQWRTDVNNINQVLSTVSQHLNEAASAYQEADTGIARGFQAG